MPPGADTFQHSKLDHAEPVRLLEGPLELTLVGDLGEVEERAGDGRNRETGDDSPILPGDSALVYGNAGPLPSPRRRDFNRRPPRHCAETPKRCCASVAENCADAAGQHGRHQLSTRGHVAIAKRIDTAMQAVEAACFDAARNRATPEPRSYELLPGKDAMLPTSESGQPSFALRERASGAFDLACRLLSTHTGT